MIPTHTRSIGPVRPSSSAARQERSAGGRLLRTLLLLISFQWTAAFAQDDDHWQFRQFQIENDDVLPVPYSQPSDRFYTNGVRISFSRSAVESTDDGTSLPAWLRWIRNRCRNCTLYPTLSMGQQIFTPENIEIEEVQPGERPWGAWLYGGLGAAMDTSPQTRHDVEFQLGVTGDAAGGEFLQTLWHRIIGSPKPRGWGNQLGTDIGINGFYTYQHILRPRNPPRVIDWDFVPNVKAAVGTIATYAGTGGTFRIGRNITDFPYSPIRPSERRVSVDALPEFEIYGFIGADVRAVAYNYFIEGSLFSDDQVTPEPKRYVWDFNFGITARFRRYNITYAVVRRSEEFERTVGTDRGIHSYGSLSFTVGLR